MSRIVLIDNHDSFVYNLVDAVATSEHELVVYRNSVPASEVFAAQPDLLILSPGPGHPREAGSLMEVLATARERNIPVLGICLGFQALLEHLGGSVVPCGPEHGRSVAMQLTEAGQQHPVFAGLATGGDPTQPGHEVPVARYHSLGCADAPEGLRVLATTETEIGDVVMAAETEDRMAVGVQFHPESILTPAGPLMLERCFAQLLTQSQKG
ncbi:glutamine amidotransferase-related protein [Corynebacterium tapiri]|uniref:anthranilate synthase n=1 Tax=Corynebacterium tapiri TaxID=1448266 RepID=A0A5C4U2Q5_9CORY|nr:gamma-glutamyl-gamma-aminobutyrate hydrolase family protein [Corynebacterium tapiri]TNL96881.1 anthranilate synthase component II [Corynebacterium tapiri]